MRLNCYKLDCNKYRTHKQYARIAYGHILDGAIYFLSFGQWMGTHSLDATTNMLLAASKLHKTEREKRNERQN